MSVIEDNNTEIVCKFLSRNKDFSKHKSVKGHSKHFWRLFVKLLSQPCVIFSLQLILITSTTKKSKIN